MNRKAKGTAYALARVAMGDSRTVARFSSRELVDAFKESRAAGKALDELVDLECSQLEKRIGAETDPASRKRLIRTRRRIRHRECLASDDSDESQQVAAALRALKGLDETMKNSFHQALARDRSALRELCLGSADFRLSMLMSSASLSDRLDAWMGENDADSQRDAALLRYWTRFSIKVSPFSRFTAVSCMMPKSVAGGIRLQSVEGKGILVRLNVQILEQLEALRGVVPAIGQSGLIVVNPTLVWRDDLLISYISTGPKGVLNDLELSGMQARMLKRLQGLGELTWAQAHMVVKRHLRMPSEEASDVIREMLERGIMVSLPPSHPMDPDWLGSWIGALKKLVGIDGPHASAITGIRNSLERLRAFQSEGLSEGYEPRRLQLESIASAYGEILSLVPSAAKGTGSMAPLRREKLVFEDIGLRLDAPIAIAGYEEVCRVLGKVAHAFAPAQQANGHFSPQLHELVARGDMSFTDFLRSWTVSQSGRAAGSAPDRSPGSDGSRWLRGKLQDARNALRANRGKASPAEINLSSSGLPPAKSEKGRRLWHTCIIQKEDDAEDSRLILNSGVEVGPIRVWSRFCDLFPTGVFEWLRASLVDPDEETIHAEIVDWNFSNVNLHPIFTKSIVLLSDRPPANFEGNILRIPELDVTMGDDGVPRLYCPKIGKFVIPVDMGLQALNWHSPVYELLALLGARNKAAADSIGEIARECLGSHTPRIVLDGRIVMAREAWQFSHSELHERRKGQTLPEFFSETMDWWLANGLPNEVFVRIVLDNATKDEVSKSDKLRRRGADDHKPTYHRFDSALFLVQWERLVDKAVDGMRIYEALPGGAGNMTMGSTRHCSEMAIHWT